MTTSLIQARLARVVNNALDLIRAEGCSMTEEELLGVMLACHLQWDGKRILRVAANALEDANYHTECEVVTRLLRDARQRVKCKH